MEFLSQNNRFGIGAVVVLLCLTVSGVAIASSSHVRVGPGMMTTSERNPASIGVNEPTFRLTLLPLDLNFSNSSWALADIDEYIDKEIPEHVKDSFLAAVDHRLRLDMSSLSAVDLGIGVVSANFALRTLSTGSVAKDLLEVALKGNELDRDYKLDSHVGAAAYGDASIGLSLGLGESLRVGGRYHRLMGVAYADASVTGKGRLESGDTIGFSGDLEAEYMYTFGEGVRGEGAAYDVGVSIQLNRAIAVGFAIMDIGQIDWHDLTLEVYEGSLDEESPDGAEFDLREQRTIGRMTWQLPRRYEAAIGLQLAKSLHLGATYTQTVHKSTEGFELEPSGRMQSMLTWNGLKFLPIGIGTAYSEAEGFTLSAEAGLRLGPLQTRARVSDVQTLLGKGESKAIGFAFDLGIVF